MAAVLTGVDRRARIGTLILDVLLTEAIDLPSSVSRYPVEDGSEVSDHITAQSETIRLAGTVPLADVYAAENGGSITGARARAADLQAQAANPDLSDAQKLVLADEMDATTADLNRQRQDRDRIGPKLVDIVDALRRMHRERQLVTVSTAQMRYEGYAMASLSAERTAGGDGGNWLSVRAELVKITKVELRTAEVPERAQGDAAGRAGQTNANAGNAGSGGGGGNARRASQPGTQTRAQTPASGLFSREDGLVAGRQEGSLLSRMQQRTQAIMELGRTP